MTLCAAAQPRLIVPGLRRDTGQTSLGKPVLEEQRRVWLVIRASDMCPVTKDGHAKPAEWHLLRDDYCATKAQANRVAKALHDRGCTLRGCEWADYEPKETKPAPTFRQYGGSWPWPWKKP